MKEGGPTRNAVRLALFALVLVLGVAASVAFVVFRPQPSPFEAPPSTVPPSWNEFRTSQGHAAHLGKKDVTCKDCHDIASGGFKNPGATVCVRCHEKENWRHHAGADKTTCLTCHAFAPNQNAPSCIGCHRETQGRLAPVTHHATTNCTDCHRLHETPAVVAKDCTTAGCHAQTNAHGALGHGRAMSEQGVRLDAGRGPADGCQECHAPHAGAKAAVTSCATCHATVPAHSGGPPPSLETMPAAHAPCTTCHKPHTFVIPAGSALAKGGVCVSCHGEKPTLLAATRAPAHQACVACHTPHAPRDAAAACATCHGTVHPVHQKSGGGAPATHGPTACVACHVPHAGTAEGATVAAKTCTSCHAKVATSDRGAHAGHAACLSCHAKHDTVPVATGTVLCARCHEPIASATARGPGHHDCATCHGAKAAHAPIPKPACASCHAVEAASVSRSPKKGHERCETCHETHGASLKPAAKCESCHAKEGASPHGTRVLGGCATCHRPHESGGRAIGAASPPACPTCHTPKDLPALHGSKSHQSCATCHASHEPPRSDRATCTSCHADRKNHQPTAIVCTGCHVFRLPHDGRPSPRP